mmetsp:Transcript_55275/g.125695  ORF Transcript_55275/g.125695 Transcript_55275/m.125695 type:complete len:235 (-) Transcript_55275:1907-2611(-)
MHLIRAALGQPITQLSQHGSASAEGVGGGPVVGALKSFAVAPSFVRARLRHTALGVASVDSKGPASTLDSQHRVVQVQITAGAMRSCRCLIPMGHNDLNRLHHLQIALLRVVVRSVHKRIDWVPIVPSRDELGIAWGRDRGGRGGHSTTPFAIDDCDAIAANRLSDGEQIILAIGRDHLNGPCCSGLQDEACTKLHPVSDGQHPDTLLEIGRISANRALNSPEVQEILVHSQGV